MKFELFSSNVVSDEFFRWILQASPLTNPIFVCVQDVSVCLKCVFASRIDFSLNLVPLYTTVSKNTVSVSDVLAVNLIAGVCKFACSMKASMAGYLCPIRKNIVYAAFSNCCFKDGFA